MGTFWRCHRPSVRLTHLQNRRIRAQRDYQSESGKRLAPLRHPFTGRLANQDLCQALYPVNGCLIPSGDPLPFCRALNSLLLFLRILYLSSRPVFRVLTSCNRVLCVPCLGTYHPAHRCSSSCNWVPMTAFNSGKIGLCGVLNNINLPKPNKRVCRYICFREIKPMRDGNDRISQI